MPLNPKLKPLTLKHNLESKKPKPLPYLPYLLLYMENTNYIYLPNQQQLHSLPRFIHIQLTSKFY